MINRMWKRRRSAFSVAKCTNVTLIFLRPAHAGARLQVNSVIFAGKKKNDLSPLGKMTAAASSSAGDPSFSLPFMTYKPGMDVGELEDWPFTNPESDYAIHDGNPRASGRIDASTPTTRMGIWKCTRGTMECTEQGDEFFMVLHGSVEVTDVATDQTTTLRQGDSMFINCNGKRVMWKVIDEYVIKAFYGCKMDGY